MFQLMARMITFQTHISQLLAPVRTHLADASQPKVYNQLANLLQHASRGISANPTATPQDVMVFIHGVLEGGLAQEEAARQLAEAEATAAVHVADGAGWWPWVVCNMLQILFRARSAASHSADGCSANPDSQNVVQYSNNPCHRIAQLPTLSASSHNGWYVMKTLTT